MDPRLASQEGIYTILEIADRTPGLFHARLGEWLAWPAAKAGVYSRLFAGLFSRDESQSSEPTMLRADHAIRRLPRAFAKQRAAIGLLPPRGRRRRVAWMVATHPSIGPDGIVRDSIVDELPRELSTHAEQLWLAPPVGAEAAGGVAAMAAREAVNELAAALEPLQQYRPSVRKAAADMASHLGAITPDANGQPWSRLLVESLSRFESRRLAWTRLFLAARPDLLLMTDAAYHTGEVAAARETGVRVVEFQHGLFGPRCPEYGWPGALADAAPRMPVADQLFVFGDLFRDAALHHGFWQPEQLRVVGAPALHRHLAVSQRDTSRTGSIPRVLFFTQRLNRGEALAFWAGYLAAMEEGRVRPCLVTFKVHPEEQHDAHAYDELVARYPDRWVVAGAGTEPLQLMQSHDVAVSYSSNALIEAIGLGMPAVSLAGTHAPAGVFGLCPVPGAAGVIPTALGAADLDRLIAQLVSERLPADAGRGFYAFNAAGAALNACLELLN